MEQLAARVDLNIIVDMEKEIIKEVVTYPENVKGMFEYFGKEVQDNSSEEDAEEVTIDGIIYTAWKCGDTETHLASNDITQYVNPKTGNKEDLKFNGTKIIEVAGGGENGIAIDSVITADQWALRINAITINNIQTQSYVILESVNSLSLSSAAWQESLDQVVSNTYKTTFYTYEKGLYANDDDADVLTVSIDADLVKGTTTTTKRYGVTKMHGIWVDGTNGTQNNGWGSNDDDIFVSVYNEGVTAGEVKDVFTEDQGTQSLSSTFVVKINPKKDDVNCHTDGVIHGNLYSTDIIFKSGFEEPVLQYNVVGWGTKTKDIPAFE